MAGIERTARLLLARWRKATLRPAEGVASVSHGDRTVLVDYPHGRYYGLDGVGTRIWKLVEQGASCAVIVDRLTEEYDAAPARLERDAAVFLARLLSARLVRLDP